MSIQVLYPFLNWLVCFLSLSFRSFSLYSGCMRAQSCLFETTWIAACRLLGPWNFPGKILEWVAIFFLRGFSWPKDQTRVTCIGRWVLFLLSRLESPPSWYHHRKDSNSTYELDKGHKHSDHSGVENKEKEKWKAFRSLMIRVNGLESTSIS